MRRHSMLKLRRVGSLRRVLAQGLRRSCQEAVVVRGCRQPIRAAATTTSLQFCRECGHRLALRCPPDDSRERHICNRCGYIDYRNPKIVVGCIVEHRDRILMCMRGIHPRKGLWTYPAGYLEIGESTASGAKRETLEEANAAVTVVSMYSMMDVPIIGQCHITYRATLDAPFDFSPGVETLQTQLMLPEEITMEQVAFTSVQATLKAYVEDRRLGRFRFHHGVIARRPEASPGDPNGYTLEDYVVQ